MFPSSRFWKGTLPLWVVFFVSQSWLPLSAQQWSAPRVLENTTRVHNSNILWTSLAFDASGNHLVASGTATYEGQGNNRTRESSHVQWWDLDSFRAMTSGFYVGRFEQGFQTRFSQDLRSVYGYASHNQWSKDHPPAGYIGPDRSGKASILFWDRDSYNVRLKSFDNEAGLFSALHLSNDGRHIVGVVAGTKIRKHDLVKVTPAPRTFGPREPHDEWHVSDFVSKHPTEKTLAAAFSLDGGMLVSIQSGTPPEFLIWDIVNDSPVASIPFTRPQGPPPRKPDPQTGRRKKRPQNRRPPNRRSPQPPSRGQAAGQGSAAVLLAENTRLVASPDGTFVASVLSGTEGHSMVSLLNTKSREFQVQFLLRDTLLDDLAVSADGNWLAYTAQGKLVLQNTQTDETHDFDGGPWRVCALSSESHYIAAAGNDNAVRLWRLPTHPTVLSALALKAPAAAENQGVLVESGPIPVWLETDQGRQNQYMFRLTSDELLAASHPKGKLQRYPASEPGVNAILTPDGKHQWRWDSANQKFTGDTIQRSSLPQAKPPQPPSQSQELAYLLLGARRLIGSVLDAAEKPGNQATLDAYKRICEQRSQYARTLGDSAASTATLYEEIANSVAVISKSSSVERQLLEEMNALVLSSEAAKSAANTRQRMQLLEGIAMIATEELGKVRVYAGSEQVTNATIDYYNEINLLPGWADAGMNHMLTTYTNHQVLERRMAAAESIANADLKKVITDNLRLRLDASSNLLDSFHAIANGQMHLDVQVDSEELSKQSAKKQLEAAQAEADRIRIKTGRADPVAQAELVALELSGSSIKAPAHFEHASRIYRMVGYVPPGEVWNSDRADLLVLAARLIVTAVEIDTGSRELTQGYHRMAGYALDLLDEALQQTPNDPTGAIRSQRALALAQAGRRSDALRQAAELAEEFANNPDVVFIAARVFCSAGEIDRGLDYLEKCVVDLDYKNFEAIKKSKDFPKAHARLKALTEGKWHAQNNAAPVLGRWVDLRNTSFMPMHDIQIEIRSRKAKLVRYVRRLEPHQQIKLRPEFVPESLYISVSGGKPTLIPFTDRFGK